MTPKPLSKAFIIAVGLGLLFFLTASRALAECPNEVKPSADDPLQMLVLGDSIMWGQGLKPEQKAWWRVKCWLQEKTGREVKERIEAHSGAVIAASSRPPSRFKSNDGEVNLPYPTVNEELDHALEFYGETRSKVNLILVDGCINDINVSNLLNAAAMPDWLREQISNRCGSGMHDLLQRITNGFPRAYVIVTGYYRIISSSTADNAFIRLLVKKLDSQRPEARHMSDKEMRSRLITLSELWYRVSTASLSEAVSKVNAEVGERSLPARVMFAEIDFWPEHSFSADDTLLWNFMFGSTNLSGFRQVVAALSFGTAAYKPNDNVRESRIKSCNETFTPPKEGKEVEAEKRFRKDSLLICKYASLGHPNQMGALIYAEAIKGHMQWLIDKAGWKRTVNPLTSP
ncbi:MAG: SGNH/GDSL hydrolase family protein [Acidobacteriota bacterium]|nr:SGNH/GDSL hydrolase family protein [Acidobacteriota bacterium]